MDAMTLHTQIKQRGELHLYGLPLQENDEVEVVLRVTANGVPQSDAVPFSFAEAVVGWPEDDDLDSFLAARERWRVEELALSS